MSASSFHQSVRGARARRPLGFYGQPHRSHKFQSITVVSTSPQAKQVTTMTVPASPDASTLYSVTVDGVTASYTTDASATQAELGAGLVEAINAKAGIRAKMIASYAGGTLTLTAVWPGTSHTVTNNAADTTNDLGTVTAATAAASAGVVEPGLVMVTTGDDEDSGVPYGLVPTSSLMTAQVMTFTIAGASGDSYVPVVRINGKVYQGDAVEFNTNADTTCTDIATEINAVLPAETVLAAAVGSGGAITFTAEVEGAEFEAEIITGVSGEAAKAYTTGPSISTSIRRAFLGLSVRRLDLENQTDDGDDPAYKANEPVEVAERGAMVVQKDTTESWSYGDELYVSVASATKGRLYNTAGTDRVWLPRELIQVVKPEHSSSSDGLGVVDIRKGA